MSWNKLDKALPECMKDVLLFDKIQGLAIGYYYAPKNSFIRECDGYTLTEVMHWSVLPVEP